MKTEPWGIYFKAKPDHNNMFNLDDLPRETYEPPSTPKGRLRQKINYLTIDFQYALKNKLINKLKVLIDQAYEIAPTELENLICHGELILR